LGLAAGDIPVPGNLARGHRRARARHDNPRDVDADVPLWRTVAVAGVSGSGKTSLAIGTLTAGDFDGYKLGRTQLRDHGGRLPLSGTQ